MTKERVMHFAQTLSASVVPEWKSRYVNFEGGKRRLKTLVKDLPESDGGEGFSELEPDSAAARGRARGPVGSGGSAGGGAYTSDAPAAGASPAHNGANNAPEYAAGSGPLSGQADQLGDHVHTGESHVRPGNHGSSGSSNGSGLGNSHGAFGASGASGASSHDASNTANHGTASHGAFGGTPFGSPGEHLRQHLRTSSENLRQHLHASGENLRHHLHASRENVSDNDDCELLSPFGTYSMGATATSEAAFFAWLDHEVLRADAFFAGMLAESSQKLHMLEKQLQVFTKHREAHHAERDAQRHPTAAKRASFFLEKLDLPSLPRCFRPKRENGQPQRQRVLPRPLSRLQHARLIRVTAHTSDFSNRGDAVGYYQAKTMLKTALAEFYHSLLQLRGFQQLNVTAIRKIVKKYDKQISQPLHMHPQTGRYLRKISDLPLFAGKRQLDDMIAAVENLYAFHFARSNHKTAVDALRAATSGAREHHSLSLLMSGILLGAAVPLGAIAVYSALHNRHFHDQLSATEVDAAVLGGKESVTDLLLRTGELFNRGVNGPDETTYLLQILGGFALLAVCLTGFAGCLFVWERYKINYAFIIGLDRATMLAPPQFLLAASAYTFWTALMAYLTFKTTQSFHRYYPILILACMVVMMLWPGRTWWNSRAWMLHSLWRLTFSGLYPVEFRDLLMGDITCSLTYSLSNLELFFCIYAASPNWWSPEGAKHALRCTSSHSRALGFLNTLPGIFRFLQCWRRFGDTLDWFPHLLNAGKYSFNILYNMSLSLARIAPQSHGLKALFIVFALINGVYSGLWDILMDFSLTPGPHKKLRSVLVFNPWCYWLLMFYDFALRQNWVLYAIFWKHKTQGAYISFVVALIEISRRIVWAAFRVENEHASNILRCRAFKDLHLPYDDFLAEDVAVAQSYP